MQFIDGVDVPVIMQRRGLLSVLGKVVDMPVVFNDRCLVLSVQKTAESAVAVLTLWSMSLFVQGRRLGLLLEVPQTQFIARVRGPSSLQRDGGLSARVLAAMLWWAFFAFLWVVPELSASFRSPR